MAETFSTIITDETGQALVEGQQQTNAYLAALAANSVSELTTDYAAIRRIVRAGLAPKVFSIGDQITVKWTDTVSGTTYDVPLDIVHFGDVEKENGDVVPGMFLQWHYATPYAIPFDMREAFYYATEELPAGTYNITIGAQSWYSADVGVTYQFTLENAVPAGGQIVFNGTYNAALEGTTVSVYESSSATSAQETATLTAGEEGTSLGTIDNSTIGTNLNQMQIALLGYNRWSQSAYRQYLNSDAAIGAWWEAQNNFNRPPTQLASYPGFLSGFEEDFLNVLGKVKVTTALNTVTDGGGSEDTYDTFFLPSLEQLYITPQVSGVEGDAWDYWKEATGAAETVKTSVTGAFPLTYAINAKTTAQGVRLRSASRGYAYNVWYINSTGTVHTNSASYAYRSAPACAIF